MRYVLCVLFSVFLMSVINATWCYQETANVSTVCGGLDTGSYGASVALITCGVGTNLSMYDTNYSTYCAMNAPTLQRFYINYTKPDGANSDSLWRVKEYNLGDTNYSIPTDCWNQTNLQFALRSANLSISLECYNGSSWNQIETSHPGLNRINYYEEAMWWNLTDPGVTKNSTLIDPILVGLNQSLTSSVQSYGNVVHNVTYNFTYINGSQIVENATLTTGNNQLGWWQVNHTVLDNDGYVSVNVTANTANGTTYNLTYGRFYADNSTPGSVNASMDSSSVFVPGTAIFYCNYSDNQGYSALAMVNWSNGTQENITMSNVSALNASPIEFSVSKSIPIGHGGINNFSCFATDAVGHTNTSAGYEFNSSNVTYTTSKTMTDDSVGISFDATELVGHTFNYTGTSGSILKYQNFSTFIDVSVFGLATPKVDLYNFSSGESNRTVIVSLTNASGSTFGYNLYNVSTKQVVEFNVTYNNSQAFNRTLSTTFPVNISWEIDGVYRLIKINNTDEILSDAKYLKIGTKPATPWNQNLTHIKIERYLPLFSAWYVVGEYSECGYTNMSAWGIYNVISVDTDSDGLKDTINYSTDLNYSDLTYLRFSTTSGAETTCGEVPPIITPPTSPGGGGGEGGGEPIYIEVPELPLEIPREEELVGGLDSIKAFFENTVAGIRIGILAGIALIGYASTKSSRPDTFAILALLGGLTLIMLNIGVYL